MQYAFHFNVERCAQCFACEVACKSAHNSRPRVQEEPGTCGPRFRQVVELKSEDSATPVQYVSMACMHCGDAACMAVCPARAIYRDPQFGAVLVDHSKCLGCRYCSWACEFGAPQFDRDGLMHRPFAQGVRAGMRGVLLRRRHHHRAGRDRPQRGAGACRQENCYRKPSSVAPCRYL